MAPLRPISDEEKPRPKPGHGFPVQLHTWRGEVSRLSQVLHMRYPILQANLADQWNGYVRSAPSGPWLGGRRINFPSPNQRRKERLGGLIEFWIPTQMAVSQSHGAPRMRVAWPYPAAPIILESSWFRGVQQQFVEDFMVIQGAMPSTSMIVAWPGIVIYSVSCSVGKRKCHDPLLINSWPSWFELLPKCNQWVLDKRQTLL